MATKVQIGTVSHGTMLEEDLIPRFADLLEELAPDSKLIQEARDLPWDEENDCYAQDDDGTPGEVLHELFDALGNHAPDYCYLGANEGDGSDYGFWVSWESLEEAMFDGDVVKVADLSDVTEGYTGMVLHVNDHGNSTLYSVDKGQLSEVWSIV
jgi:hypothetical protein